MLILVWNYLKNPVYEEDENTDIHYRIGIVFKYVLYSLVISLLFLALSASLETLFNLEVGKHASEDFMNISPWLIIGSVVILAPVFEELIFRGPMSLFKESPFFKFSFYVLTIAFGYIHIFNFEMNVATILLSPLLVMPQINLGIFAGYIRVRFDLLWSILLHAMYNLFLTGPILVLQFLDIPLE